MVALISFPAFPQKRTIQKEMGNISWLRFFFVGRY
jgi:hypothetical protein